MKDFLREDIFLVEVHSDKTSNQHWIINDLCSISDFPGGLDGEASAYDAGDPGSVPGSGKISWRRKWQPTPVFLPGKSHGWKSLVGYSPWDHKESETRGSISQET